MKIAAEGVKFEGREKGGPTPTTEGKCPKVHNWTGGNWKEVFAYTLG